MQAENQSTYKIYSRKRFCLNTGNSPRKKRLKQKIKKVIPIIIVMVVSFLTYYFIWDSVNPIFETACKDEAKSIATRITNEESTLVMKKHNYDDFFSIQKDENDNIKMVSANVLNINQVTSDIAFNIQNSLNKSSNNKVKIPIGSMSGIKMFSGYGPIIYIKLSTVGSVDTNLKSEFISQGINQTLHRVYLEIECKVNILTSHATIEDKIFNQVVLAENVIIGEIPTTYYNLKGLDSKDDMLEIIE